MRTMDLIEFLRARLDEDERIAEAASPGPWAPNAETDEVLAVDGERVADGFALSGRQLRATVEHIARHDPARVLADVAAKRRIIEMCENAQAAVDRGSISTYVRGQDTGARDVLDEAVRALALSYVEHPDYPGQ